MPSYQAPPKAPADLTDLSIGMEGQEAPAPAQPAQQDEMCQNGLHMIYNPDKDAFESAGPCDQMHEMSQEASNPTDQSLADALHQKQVQPAGNGLPPDPQEMARTQALLQGLREQLQGPKKPQRMGVPGAAESVEKAFK